MNSLIIITLISFHLVFGEYKIFLNNDDRDDLTQHITDVIEFVSKTHHGGYINMVYNNGYERITNRILEYVHKHTISKMITLNMDDNRNDNRLDQMKIESSYLGYLRLMLILTNTTENVVGVINKLNGTVFYQTRSRVLILLSSTPTPEDLIEMFNLLWSKKFPLVICSYLNQNQIKTFSFNPFFNQFLQDYSTKNASQLFYNIFQNINGKKLNVLLLKYDERDKIELTKHPNGTVEWGGPEIKLLRNIIHKMNGTEEIIPASYVIFPGERDPWRQTNDLNSTKTAIEIKKRILRTKQIDIMSTEEIIIPDEVSGVTESLYPHSTDNMKIMMRRSPRIPYFRYLFMVYNYKVWGLYIVTIIVSTIGWCITGSDLYPSWINKFVNLIRVLSGSSLPRISSNHSERVFISVYLIFSLIMSTAFTCNLASVLMQNRYYPNIDTLDELLEGGYIIVGFGTQIRELRKAFNNTPKYPLFERAVFMPDKYAHADITKNNMTNMLRELRDCVVATERRAVYVTKHKIFKDWFHIVKESPLPNYTALHVPIGSQYFDCFNSILRRIIEFGLYLFWVKQHDHDFILKKVFFKPDEADETRTEAKPITIDHLQAPFLIYFIGLIGSLIAFIIELIMSKIKYFKNKIYVLKY